MKTPIFLIDDYYKKGLISPKVRNGLLRSNIKNISQLFNLNESEIKNLRGFGEATIAELENLIETLKNETDFNVKASNELKSQFSKKVSFLKSYLLKDLNFSLRTKNCLEKENINSLYDLVNCSLNDLKKIKDFGATCADEIVQFLNKNNLSLGYDLDAIESKALSDLRIFDFPQEILDLDIIREPKIILSQREEKIINLWNEEMLTLEEIGKRLDVTRERIRQILAKLQNKGYEVISKRERSERRKKNKKDKALKLSKKFIELYKKHPTTKIASKLNLDLRTAKYLEKKLLMEGKLYVPFTKNKTETDVLIVKRREEILNYKSANMSTQEISEILGVSTATIYNDILHLRKQGINVPNSKEKLGLSEEKIQFRLNFIESKLQAGWNKSEIAKALGMDYSSLHHFVKRHS